MRMFFRCPTAPGDSQNQLEPPLFGALRLFLYGALACRAPRAMAAQTPAFFLLPTMVQRVCRAQGTRLPLRARAGSTFFFLSELTRPRGFAAARPRRGFGYLRVAFVGVCTG